MTMHKLKNRWQENRSNFQIFLSKMYYRYLREKDEYNETDILSEYEYNKRYNDWLRIKYKHHT